MEEDNFRQSHSNDKNTSMIKDDINSINSDTTTHHRMTKEEANNIVPPRCTPRFQLQEPVQAEDAGKMSAQIVNSSKDVPTSGSQILLEAIKSCLKEMRSFDERCIIISWKDRKTFDHIAPNDFDKNFPTTTAKITKFFPRYRPTTSNKNKNFCATIKMRVATSRPLATFTKNMTEWASTNGLTFKKTVIQAENPAVVGWLVYSSSFTDEIKLRKILSTALDIEWGFRTQNVTKTDSALNF